jgi:hypothetical protein
VAKVNNSLYRIIYISQNKIKGDEAQIRLEVEQILAISRVKNAHAQITGALMFNSGLFAQVLEGRHDAIQDTFERIQCDPRHSHVAVLAFEPVTERGFSNWSMGYISDDSLATAKFRDITQASGFDPEALKGERIFELLKEHLLEAE